VDIGSLYLDRHCAWWAFGWVGVVAVSKAALIYFLSLSPSKFHHKGRQVHVAPVAKVMEVFFN